MCDDDQQFKADPSQLLTLLGLVRHFFETRAGHHAAVARERASFDAACAVIDVEMDAKRGKVENYVSAGLLRAALSRHMELHIAAYGRGHLKPKHHWLYDVAEQWLRDDLVLDAFVVERLHLRVKSVADNVENTSDYERSVLACAMVQQRKSLLERKGDGLRGRVGPLPGYPRVQVAKGLECGTMRVQAGEIVFFDGSVGLVLACAQ